MTYRGIWPLSLADGLIGASEMLLLSPMCQLSFVSASANRAGLYRYQQGIHRVSNPLGGDTDSLLIERSAVTGLPP